MVSLNTVARIATKRRVTLAVTPFSTPTGAPMWLVRVGEQQAYGATINEAASEWLGSFVRPGTLEREMA